MSIWRDTFPWYFIPFRSLRSVRRCSFRPFVPSFFVFEPRVRHRPACVGRSRSVGAGRPGGRERTNERMRALHACAGAASERERKCQPDGPTDRTDGWREGATCVRGPSVGVRIDARAWHPSVFRSLYYASDQCFGLSRDLDLRVWKAP